MGYGMASNTTPLTIARMGNTLPSELSPNTAIPNEACDTGGRAQVIPPSRPAEVFQGKEVQKSLKCPQECCVVQTPLARRCL